MRQSGKQFGIPCPLHHGWAWLKQDNRFYQLHVSIAQCLGQPRGTLEPAARQQHPWSSWMHYIWQIMFRMHCSEQKPKQYTICMHTSDKKMFYLLSPISRIADAGGPMNLSPCLSQSCAKSALSERKPYPGWIACTKQIGGKNDSEIFVTASWHDKLKLHCRSTFTLFPYDTVLVSSRKCYVAPNG